MSSNRNRSSAVSGSTDTRFVSPNEVMNSYIGDLLGNAVQVLSEEDAARPLFDASKVSLPSTNAIKPGYQLITCISLTDYVVDVKYPRHALVQTLLLLLWGLELLRKPIFGRLRASLLEHCHEMVMQQRFIVTVCLSPLFSVSTAVPVSSIGGQDES